MKLKILTAVLMFSIVCLSLSGCFKFATEETTAFTEYSEPTTLLIPETTVPAETTTFAMPETLTQETTQEQKTEPFTIIIPQTTQEAKTEPKTEPKTTEKTEIQTTKRSYSTYSKAEIIKLYSDALSKTRSYSKPITVHHKESFTGDVVEASPGGALTTQLANYLIGAIADPSESDYSFSGGTATNEDGETIPLLLPQRTSFSLPEEAVKNASVSENNGTLTVHIELVSESVDFGEVPKYNSTAVGYLDTTQFSFKIITVNSCTITYSGSTIDAVIRPDGYISDCTYVINLSTTGNVTGMGITGGGTIAGAQTEIWSLNW